MQKRFFTLLLKFLPVLSVLWASACTTFDKDTAEENIRKMLVLETERLYASPTQFTLNFARTDSIMADSLYLLSSIKINTVFARETLSIKFNQKREKDTIITIGDSAKVAIERNYKGTMDVKLTHIDSNSTLTFTKNFNSTRMQSAKFAEDKTWALLSYTLPEERSDTNTTQIFSLKIKGKGIDTTIYSVNSMIKLKTFPKLASGVKLSLELRTVADTSNLICFAKGKQQTRFTPTGTKEDRWKTELTTSSTPLIIGIINKKALLHNKYPVDFDLWIIPFEH